MTNTDTRALVRTGQVLEALPSFRFKVALDDGKEILAYASGKLRMNKIRILPGDKVTVEFSPYDKQSLASGKTKTKGRITYRGVKSTA